MRPTWENTFNGGLKFWGGIGYTLDHAARGGYKFLLWTDGRIYQVCAPYHGGVTEWVKADLYK